LRDGKTGKKLKNNETLCVKALAGSGWRSTNVSFSENGEKGKKDRSGEIQKGKIHLKCENKRG